MTTFTEPMSDSGTTRIIEADLKKFPLGSRNRWSVRWGAEPNLEKHRTAQAARPLVRDFSDSGHSHSGKRRLYAIARFIC